jgi:hypothetical protein
MSTLLKLNEMRNVIKNGGIINKGRLFNKGEQTERFGEKVAQEVYLRHFCCNGSGKQKKNILQKFK